MKNFLVEYKHIEETTYRDWVEAESEEQAIEIVESETPFDNDLGTDSLEVIDIEVIEED